jgi:hypothetical protein
VTDDDLLKLGFIRHDNGVLLAPFGVAVRFTPVSRFFEVSITARDGNTITAVVPRVALKLVEGVKL